MKTTTKMLPLVAIMSGALFGCGGGDSGGGSSSGGTTYNPTDYVTLTFVQMVDTAAVPSGCTVFAEKSGALPYTYARLAEDVAVQLHDADGVYQESLTPDSNGSLRVNKYDIEDGGYLSVIDSPDDSLPYYRVLSIQKELLETGVIKVGRPQGVKSSCYTDDEAPNADAGSLIVNTNGYKVNQYRYLSSLEDSGLTPNNSHEITRSNGEPVLVTGYDGSLLTAYAFISTLGSSSSPEIASLNGLDTLYPWSNNIVGSVGSLSELNVRLGSGTYTYDWVTPDVATEAKFNISSEESDWFYSASGTLSTGWDFQINGALGSTLDVLVPSSITITSGSPSIEENSSIYQVNVSTVESTKNLIVRTKYTQSYNSNSETLEHIVIGEPSDSGHLTIPDLGYSNLLPVSPESLVVDMFEVDSIEGSYQQALISQYEDEDQVSLVITPAEQSSQQYYLNSSSYVQLSR